MQMKNQLGKCKTLCHIGIALRDYSSFITSWLMEHVYQLKTINFNFAIVISYLQKYNKIHDFKLLH